MYKKLFNTHAQAHTIMWASRLGSIAISCIALFIARNNSASIYELVNYSWSGLGSSFGPVVIMALYGKHITRYGAIAGLIAGGITAGSWPYLHTSVLPLVPGFMVGLATIWIVSKFTYRANAV